MLEHLLAGRAVRTVFQPLVALDNGQAEGQDVLASQPVIRSLISCGRSTSMKWPTPSMSSEADPGPP